MAFSLTPHQAFSSCIFSSSSSDKVAPRILPFSLHLPPHISRVSIVRAVDNASEAATTETKAEETSNAKATPAAKKPPKPVFSMKKGQIVRVDKEKYLNSVNYLSVGHPPYYKGLDYIYEDRGEVLDLRMFETGEHALVAWVGIPTSPAWLPTDMLIKVDKLVYERM